MPHKKSLNNKEASARLIRLSLITLLQSILLILFLIPNAAIGVSLLQQGGITPKSGLNNPLSYTEDIHARTVGDAITVRVIENVNAIKVSNIDLVSNTDHDASLRFNLSMTMTSSLTPEANNIANQVTNFDLPALFGKSKRKNINVENSETFTTLVSALVIELDPENGNMVVEGSRQILIEGETKSLYLRGVVHPKDIDANNEIPSYKLANAQFQIIGSGSLSKERDKGVVLKIFNSLF